MGWALLALGLVLVTEGLVYALAPSLVEEMLAALKRLPVETRRLIGLGAMVAGLGLLFAAQAMLGL